MPEENKFNILKIKGDGRKYLLKTIDRNGRFE